MQTKHSRFTRSQLLDALRRHACESQADCAKRIGKTVRSVTNYMSLGVPDKQWVGILRAYGVDAAGAETIAAGLPVLKAGVAQEEIARREAASQNMEGRDPADRKPGEPRWWLGDEFSNKGTVDEPMVQEGTPVYTPGFSLVLAVIDARTKRGMDTSKHAVVQSCVENMLCRNPNADSLAEAQFGSFFDKLVEEGAIENSAQCTVVAAHIEETAILHQPIGDPQLPFPLSGGQHSSTLLRYVSFAERFEVAEDLLDEEDEQSGEELI